MKEILHIACAGGTFEVEPGTRVSEILPRTVGGFPVLAAMVNNMVVSLETPFFCDADAAPLTVESPYGAAVCRDTFCFLAAKAAKELFPDRKFRVHSSIGSALWCTLGSQTAISKKETDAIAAKLGEYVAKDLSVSSRLVSYKDAVEILKSIGAIDELHLLEHRNPPAVMLNRCEGFYALNQTPLAARTGLLGPFEMYCGEDGMMLNICNSESPRKPPELPKRERWMAVYSQNVAKARLMDVETVGDLNTVIAQNRFPDYVRAVESFQTKNLARIADEICGRKEKVRLVLLSGPSSAGKTTTADRLCTQLRVNGVRPMHFSTDDYFVGDSRNPRDENGNFDYETIEAVDCERLSADLNALFAGGPVRLRKFDFNRHEGREDGKETVLPPGGVVVLEGIHALNPALVAGVDDSVKYRIFANAFTQLAVDSCNRISARDTRLLRRLVRDSNYRGQSALDTLKMWPSVYAGEKKWIYPFQNLADAIFNTALDYELAVLKPFATMLLDGVKPWDAEFAVARRLSGLLHNFSPAPPDAVPGDSILRESIGGSQLSY